MKKVCVAICMVIKLTVGAGNVSAEPAKISKQEEKKPVRLVCQLGISSGGEKLATATFDNGEDESIRAGGLFSASVGVIVNPFSTMNKKLETQLSVGYKQDSTSAENGDITFSRVPLEVIQFYRFDNFRIGAGLTYHINPTLDGDGFAGDLHAKFDDALGFVVEADYFFGYRGFVGIKTTIIDYEIGGYEVEGNSYGLVLGAIF